MKIKLAGGVGEHGRNCFLVQGKSLSFLVDCGVMAGAEQPYPHLAADEARALACVFLTHSHADHTGALPWLRKLGYTGPVIASQSTLEQLPFHLEAGLSLEKLSPTGEGTIHGLSFRWGRSGHCEGSVWYRFLFEGRSLLFSGDYTEEGAAYQVDPIRNMKADIAVLDSAFGAEQRTGNEMRRDFLNCTEPFCSAGIPLLLPIPKYGRGLDLLLVLYRSWPDLPFYGDAYFIHQVCSADKNPFWFTSEILQCVQDTEIRPLTECLPEKGVYFLSDPQLKSVKAENYARRFSQGGVILTGTVEQNTGSNRLLQAGLAKFCRLPVHCADWERKRLEVQNQFQRVVPYHSTEWPLCTQCISL